MHKLGKKFGSVFQNVVARALRHGARIYPRELKIEHPDVEFLMLGDWTTSAGIGKDFKTNGCHEPIATEAFINALKRNESAVVYDVGASYGYYTCCAASVADPKVIISFEADVRKIRMIEKSINRYYSVKLDIRSDPVGDGTGNTIELQEVYPEPDIMKVDIDGHETNIFEGLNYDTDIILEVHDSSYGPDDYQHRRAKIVDWLNSGDHDLWVCFDHRALDEELKPVADPDSLPEESDFENDYLLVAFQ